MPFDRPDMISYLSSIDPWLLTRWIKLQFLSFIFAVLLSITVLSIALMLGRANMYQHYAEIRANDSEIS